MSEVLSNKGLYITTQALYDAYDEQIKKAYRLRDKNGMQFTASGLGFELELSQHSNRGFRNVVALSEEGDKNKLVINNPINISSSRNCNRHVIGHPVRV